jgi:hypothetical protein
MDEQAKLDEDMWNSITDTLDLLFAKMEEIDRNQQRADVKFDMSAKVVEQMLKDQQMMAKQLENTGKAAAQLRMDFLNAADDQPSSSTKSNTATENQFAKSNPSVDVHKKTQRSTHPYNHGGGEKGGLRGFLPKMNFPRFNGKNLNIWKNKCEDHYKLLNIPEAMWTTAASLHMEGNAESWLQVYKLKVGLGSWRDFIRAVQEKFGAYDYQHAIDELLDLQQNGSVTEYAAEFEALQY